jgi:hypothetical protein
VVDNTAEKLNVAVLGALVNLFECDISDLMVVVRAEG